MPLDDYERMTLEAVGGIAGSRVRDLFDRLMTENNELRTRNERLARGLPDGVTSEEWDIIRELRIQRPSQNRGDVDP